MKRTLFVVGAALLATSCAPVIKSSLRVNQEPFSPTACHSGQRRGFLGVDLEDEGGRRLRLVWQPSGAAQGYLFSPGGRVGASLGTCGPLDWRRQSVRVGGVWSIEGNAQIECSDGVQYVEGTVEFEHCR